ncbi:hypothetical protein LR48_Vigan05g113700 [Vigna angularis]|uniref:Transposase (putative) gypsy type domain-containing protein n=1 Tax=Phaseolus angularis TaxID=3914 RepID=A0A0L9ULB5_PHAAN|nr:hypothetical protein LR48_Vigan05g113700 [Vigna angularis]
MATVRVSLSSESAGYWNDLEEELKALSANNHAPSPACPLRGARLQVPQGVWLPLSGPSTPLLSQARPISLIFWDTILGLTIYYYLIQFDTLAKVITAGRGDGGAVGDDDQSSSLSSVSSSYLERSEQERVLEPQRPVNSGERDSEPRSLVYSGERVINGVALELLVGGVDIDDDEEEPPFGPQLHLSAVVFLAHTVRPSSKTFTPFDLSYEPFGLCLLLYMTVREWLADSLGMWWASQDVSLYVSDYDTKAKLQWWVDRSHIVSDDEDARLIRLGVNWPNEWVFHRKGSSVDDFFFVYAYLFNQLLVRVPITAFQWTVLRELNIAPSQLHPNDWASVQEFVAMCSALGTTPMVTVFLYYFNVCLLAKRGWVFLMSASANCLFKPFLESFKNFKRHYFKVIIRDSDRSEFHNKAERPLFPFYCTRDPHNITTWPVSIMNPVDLDIVRIINGLPCRLPARRLVECLGHEDFDQLAFGMETGVASSFSRAPRPPPLKKVTAATRSRPPSSGVTARGAVEVTQPEATYLVVLKQSLEMDTPSVVHLERKRKVHKEAEVCFQEDP